jgi:UDP:flavonoid glycosyltransferase YjiC (YdhE family)
LLIGVSNSILLAKALSEARSIPFAIARLQPMTVSGILPPVMFSIARRNVPAVLSRGAFYVIFKMLWGVMRPAINDIVRPQLGLRPYPWYGPYFRDLHMAKAINGFSQHVLPRPTDWPDNSQVTGYWFFDQPQWTPPVALNRFLAAGPKPVYIGFGSMVSSNAKAFTQTVLDGVKKNGLRAVLATGWGALDGDDGPQDEQIFFLRHAPHDGLFPLMSGAVHHGGAGTTAAAARAGIPSVVVPFFGDQPFWAHCLNRQGVAPPALERKSLTADALASALAATQQPSMIRAAAALGHAIRAENGVDEAVNWLRTWNLLPPITAKAEGEQAARIAW